jgi:hypothetical protein
LESSLWNWTSRTVPPWPLRTRSFWGADRVRSRGRASVKKMPVCGMR